MKKAAKACVMLLTMGIFAVMVAGPAAAAEAGSGAVLTGTWTDNGPDCGGTCYSAASPPTSPPFGCGGGVSSTTASWDQFGTYTATQITGTMVNHVSRTGATTATMTSSDRYDFGPLGSYAAGAGCIGAPNHAVTAHVDVTAPASAVSCSLDGSFTRAQVSVVVVQVSGNCTVNGVGPTAVSQTFTLNVLAVPDPLGVGLPSLIAGVMYTET